MAKEYAIEVQAKAYCELYSGILQDNLPLEEDMRTKARRLNQQGEDLFKKGDLEGALNAFTRAIEIHPNFATAHNNLGVLYYNQGEKDKALNQYQQGVQLQPENNTFQKNLADFYYVEQGRVEEAMQIYVKILNANPEDIEILLVLANICINLEKFDDAKYFYNRILNIEPGNKDAKGFLEKLEKCQLSDAGGRLDPENNGDKTPDMQIHQAAKGGDQDRNRFVPEWKLVYERYHKLPGSTPLVSVIIPCYNYGKYLREAVESVIIQTFQDFEIIIINDGSTDNSKDVAEQLIKVYSEHRIRLLDQKNSGQPAISRNNGIALATGEYILPLDADDKLHPQALENYYNKIKRYGSNPVVAFGWLQSFGADKSLWAAGEFNPHSMLRRGQVPSSSMYHRSVWEVQNGYRLNVPGFEDWDFWIGAIRIKAKFFSVGQITTYYRKTKNASFIDKAVIKHEWYVAKIIKNNEEIYENSEIEWADDYLSRNPEPPAKREIHGPKDRFPLVGALLVASHPERYTEEEGSWAVDYLKQHPFTFTKKLENCMTKQPEAAMLSITAIIAAYNEGDIIYHVIRDYVEQGIRVYLIDHHSTDNTVAEASKWLGKGLIQIERFPEDAGVEIANDVYAWRFILQRKEQIASAMGPGWYIHADADEFREAPMTNLNLRRGIERADREGFNAINFKIYDFKPTDNNFIPGEDVRDYLKFYDPDIHEFNHVQIKCWKNYGQKFTMWQSGGYSVEFEGRKVYPIPFILRHYAIRSQTHGEKKVFAERKARFDKEERAAKWHNQYDEIKDHSFQFIRNRTELILFERDIACRQILGQKEDSTSSVAGYYEFLRPEIQAMVDKRAKKILDVGCATGKMAAALKQKFSAEVWGIELVDEVALEASKHLDKVISGDIETALSELPDANFDTIIFADVLEHLEDPYSVLRKMKSKLDPGGQIIASIPNVRHWSVLKDLIEGRWDYKDAGILDKTHLRFFTRNSVIEMFQNAGFNILDIQATILGDQSAPEKIVKALYQAGLEVSSLKEDSRHYQYLVKAVARQVSTDVQPSQPLVSIIILTCNQFEFTKKCLESIVQNTKTPYELIVVDNGSTDDTVEYLEAQVKEKQPEKIIKVVKNKTNLGFAAGNNQGIAVAGGEYILLLNNDVVVTPGWLDRMIACLDRHPQIGIVGPRSNYVSGPQLVSSISYNVDTLKGLNDYSANFAAEHAGEATRILRVVGFCMLLKRSVIEKIGGMDERYGLGNFEDDDFSLRAAFAGFESWMAEDCFIHHFGSRTFAGAKIDFSKSLQRNWDIFKKKWELPDELPYGSPYSLSQIPIDGFDPARHYFPLSLNESFANDEMTGESSSVEKKYTDIQREVNNSSPEETIDKLESLLAAYPGFAIAHNDLGVLYYNLGNKEKAVNYYQKAVGIEPENIIFQKNLADFLYVESGMVEEALQIYVKILAICPEDIETLLITGHICVAIKKCDDAEAFYNRVLEIDPRNESARQNLVALKNYQADNDAQMSDESHAFLKSKKEADVIRGNQIDNPKSKTDDHRFSVSIILSLEGLQNCLEDCLKCIKQYTSESYEIIFLNNGATKAVLKWTQRMVAEYHNYRLLNVEKNIGWSECINRGIHASAGEFIVILHNDVVVSEAWLSDMLECLKRDSKIGIVGPMTNRAAGIQKDINTNYRSIDHFETYAKKFRKRNRYRRVPLKNISEICLIFRRELTEAIGYFDENLETEAVAVEDLCSRIAMQEYENVVAADVYIHHHDRHNTKMNGSETEQKKVEDRKVFKKKFTGLEMKSPVSEKFQVLKILEQADELNQKDQLDQALDTLLSGIGMGPDEQKYYLTLAEILLNSGRFKDALDALREMPEKEEAGAATHQKIRKYELLGYCEDGLGRHREAEEYTEHVLSLNPSSESALNLKGILAFKHNNKKAAEEFFKKAIKSDPGYGEPYTNLGTLKWEEGQEKDALRLYEKGFILTPTDLDIATIYHSAISTLDEFERAHSVVLDAAAMHPHNKKIQYLFIDILIQLGKYDRAMSEIEAAIVKFGHNDGILSAALKIRELLGPNQISETQRRTAVSLCMIVKNEEQYLAHCLASVKPIVDEMIVVDTGSTDSTKDIAVSFGAMIYDYDWNDNFAEARNFSISKASGNWVLIMDADEVISHLDYTKFKEIVKVPHKNPAAYSIITRNYCTLANTIGWVANDGKYFQEEAGIGWIPSVKVRLFYGKDLIWFEGVVHELLDPVLKRKGIKIEPCGIPVHHYGRLNRDNLDRKGEIYFEIGKKKLEEMGDDLNALRELAIQATIIGKNKDAIELWERLLALKPDPKFCAEVFINMGTVYSRMGKYQDALYASKMATAHSPELKEAIYNYAMAELHLGNAGKTIEVLEEMLTKVPEYPPAQFVLVAAYACQGSKERALEGLRKLKSTKMGSVFVFSCVELAKGLISADQIDYAISLLSAAIESEIVNADLLNIFKECLNIKERTETFDDINTQLSIFANQKNKLKCAAGDVSLTY